MSKHPRGSGMSFFSVGAAAGPFYWSRGQDRLFIPFIHPQKGTGEAAGSIQSIGSGPYQHRSGSEASTHTPPRSGPLHHNFYSSGSDPPDSDTAVVYVRQAAEAPEWLALQRHYTDRHPTGSSLDAAPPWRLPPEPRHAPRAGPRCLSVELRRERRCLRPLPNLRPPPLPNDANQALDLETNPPNRAGHHHT